MSTQSGMSVHMSCHESINCTTAMPPCLCCTIKVQDITNIWPKWMHGYVLMLVRYEATGDNECPSTACSFPSVCILSK